MNFGAEVLTNLACDKSSAVLYFLLDPGRIFLKIEILSEGLRITLTNNVIKDIIKVICSLENRGILFKGTTRKISSQKGGFLNFLKPLITAALLSMKGVLTPLAKNV